MSEHRHPDLVAPEGVNEGSAEQAVEDADTGAGADPRPGGDPRSAPRGAELEGDRDLLGPPAQGPGSASGQEVGTPVDADG